jgi:hypothetical protein
MLTALLKPRPRAFAALTRNCARDPDWEMSPTPPALVGIPGNIATPRRGL